MEDAISRTAEPPSPAAHSIVKWSVTMDDYNNLRQQIGRDLDTLSRQESPKSIFELAEDYLLGDPSLKRQLVENIIKEEADKRNIEIH